MPSSSVSPDEKQQITDSVELTEEYIPLHVLKPLPYVSREDKKEDFEDLYESVKEEGLKQPFVVARPPDSEDYVLIAGGNSRLELAHRLHDESRGSQFTEVPCVVIPWPGISSAKLSHLITNDVLHNASFIERAKAILNFIDTNSDLPIDRTTSDRGVSKFFKDHGFPLYRTTYAAMKYAVDHLDKYLPISLAASLSALDVKHIQNLESELKHTWIVAGKSEPEFNELFGEIASSCDHEDLDYETLHSVLTEDMTRELQYFESTHKNAVSREPLDNDNPIAEAEPRETKFIANSAYTVTKEQESNAKEVCISPHEQNPGAQIRKLASEIASQFDLQDCISLNDRGEFGFLVVELPSDETSQTARLVWEYLVNFSGTCELSKTELDPILSPASRLYQELQEHAIAPSLEIAKELDLSLMWTIDSENFKLLLQLWRLVFEHTSFRPSDDRPIDMDEFDSNERIAA